MKQTALLPLRRKACWGFFRPKNPTASAGFEPANLGILEKLHHFFSVSKICLIWCYKYTLFAVDTSFSGNNLRITLSSQSFVLISNITVWHHICESCLQRGRFVTFLHSMQIYGLRLSYLLGSFLLLLPQNAPPNYVMIFFSICHQGFPNYFMIHFYHTYSRIFLPLLIK
jgi:hypothetical protein